MLPLDKNEAFDDYNKSKMRLEMDNNIGETPIENLNKSRITINYNGPVMQFHSVDNKDNEKEKTTMNKIGSIIKTAAKILKVGTKAIGITAPVVAPLLLTNSKTKQLLLDTISDKKVITIDKKSKEYFDSLKENDIFYLFYNNELDRTPLTDYLTDIDEFILVDKVMHFDDQDNEFVKFFIKYLKRRSVMIKYTEFKSKENNMVMEIEYLLYRFKKKLYIKINSYALRRVSSSSDTNNECEHIDDSKVEILRN